ncbi:MAG: GTP 3',8-cyclase MoaA [Opitutales bacterium]
MPAAQETSPPKPLDRRGRPLRDLRLSVTDRCNLRCRYCMPAEVFGADYPFLPPSKWLDFDTIERLVRAFVANGVDKVRLTGGEPLLRPRLPELVQCLARVPGVRDLALSTNAIRLPKLARELREAGLRRVNISLDALNPAALERMSGGTARPEAVIAGLDAALEAGLPTKLNAVLQQGVNADQIVPLARFARERGVTLRFIEYMDVGNHNAWQRGQVVPAETIRAALAAEFPFESQAPERVGEVARRYRYLDGAGEFGIIPSISAPFCGDCNRARVSAEGQLFTCLFATSGHDLRAALAANWEPAQLAEFIGAIWQRREDRYSELRAELEAQGSPAPPKVEMSYVGG